MHLEGPWPIETLDDGEVFIFNGVVYLTTVEGFFGLFSGTELIGYPESVMVVPDWTEQILELKNAS